MLVITINNKFLKWLMIINSNIIARDLQGEMVLLNKENGDYFTLNSLGSEIYNCICEGKETVEIVDLLFEEYDISYDRLKADIMSLIDNMKKKNILIKE